MLKFTALLALIVVVLLLVPAVRNRFVEELKDLSDRLLLRFLLFTSQFERGLTRDGKEEQKLWRAQRLRNLRGLSLRSRRKFEKTEAPG